MPNYWPDELSRPHSRGAWVRAGGLFGGRSSLGCTCGWRSPWTRLQYEAEQALKDHLAAVNHA